MRSPRKLALGLAALAATLLVALLVLPLAFKDRIVERLRAEVNESVEARVGWDGVSLSLLRDFPNVTLGVDDLAVVGMAPFKGDTLVAMREARLVLDLRSVVGNLRRGTPIVVREVTLRRPDVRLRVLADGRANWDIARSRATSPSDSSRPLDVTLRSLRITDGAVSLDDRQANLTASVKGLQETLSGDFAKDEFTLSTETRADTVSLRFAGIPYLERVGVELKADVGADLPRNRFTVRDASLRLNALTLAFSGAVTTGKPDLGLDLTFSSPGTAFADILSLVPAIHARDFEKLQTAGTMAVAGRVRGSYGPRSFPALALRARVKDGAFRYPDLPLPARDVAMELAIDNPGGHADSTVIRLERLHAVIGRRPLDARLVMRTPVSDPDVDLRLVGVLDLADLARTVKLDGVKQLNGRVAANVAMRTRLSDVDAGRYDRVDARGTVNVARVTVVSDSVRHPVAVDTAALRLTPRTAQLTAFAARVGRSDVRASGSLDNILGYLLRDDDLRGSATLASRYIDLDEWRSDEETTVIPIPSRVDFALDAAVDRVRFGALDVANVRGSIKVRNQRATLDDLSMEMLRGTVVASGFYETTVPERPTFDIDLRVASVDIPTAFAALTTVQQLAPIARWAQGSVSGSVGLRGPLRKDMAPELTAISGKGEILTERLVVQNAPVLARLADALSLDRLRNPALGAIRVAYDVADGRLHTKPFAVALDGIDMTVAGSNGIDRSIAYDLALAVPRAALGAGLARLTSQARQAGVDLSGQEVVQLGAKVTGTVTDPAVRPDFTSTAATVRQAAQEAVREQVETRTAAVRERADSAADEARRRAREEADRLVAEAERQAEQVRAEARGVAARIRSEAALRADSLVARARNPAARVAAGVAADRMKQEADEQAERIIREADARAEAMVTEAKRRAEGVGS